MITATRPRPGTARAGPALGRPAHRRPARDPRLHAHRHDPAGPPHPAARRARPHPDDDLRQERQAVRPPPPRLPVPRPGLLPAQPRGGQPRRPGPRASPPPPTRSMASSFDATVTAHKAAVVDVLDWLVERGALKLSDGSAESWAQDSERGDALYDIDHDICAALFRPARPVQHLTSAAGLLDATLVSAKLRAQREAAAQRAARALIEYPVVYYAQAEPEVADALRSATVAENLARLTGPGRRAPGRGHPARRLLRPVHRQAVPRPRRRRQPRRRPDARQDRRRHRGPGEALAALPMPPAADDHRDLLARIDSALPAAGVVRELAWSNPQDAHSPERTGPQADSSPSPRRSRSWKTAACADDRRAVRRARRGLVHRHLAA